MGYSPRGRKESDTTERLHFTQLKSVGPACLASKGNKTYLGAITALGELSVWKRLRGVSSRLMGSRWAKGGEHVNLGVRPSKAHRAPTSGVTDTDVLYVLRPVGHLFAPLGDPQSQSRMLSAPREGGNSASNSTRTWDSAFPLFSVITEVIAGNPSWRHVLPAPPQISKGGLPASKSTSGMRAPPFCGRISSLVMKMAAGTKMAPKWSHSHDKGCDEDKKMAQNQFILMTTLRL